MDRIDPEHIFRIFNVFSAQFDLDKDENKFGFDKIILVCDLDNIRNIFANKYGQNVDFSGYIDKFYDIIFNFEHTEEAVEFLKQMLINNPNRLYRNGKEYTEINFVSVFLEFLLRSKILTFRVIINTVSKTNFGDRENLDNLKNSTHFNQKKRNLGQEEARFLEIAIGCNYYLKKIFPNKNLNLWLNNLIEKYNKPNFDKDIIDISYRKIYNPYFNEENFIDNKNFDDFLVYLKKVAGEFDF